MSENPQSVNNQRRTTIKERVRRLFRRGFSLCGRNRRLVVITDLSNLSDLTREHDSPSPNTNDDDNECLVVSTGAGYDLVMKKINDKMYSLFMRSINSGDMVTYNLPSMADVFDSKLVYFKRKFDHNDKIYQNVSNSTTYEPRDSVPNVPALHCFICNEFFIKPVKTQCGHVFCEWCLQEFKHKLTYKNCPECDEEITETRPCVHSEELIQDIMKGASDNTKQKHRITTYKRAFLAEKKYYQQARNRVLKNNRLDGSKWY